MKGLKSSAAAFEEHVVALASTAAAATASHRNQTAAQGYVWTTNFSFSLFWKHKSPL